MPIYRELYRRYLKNHGSGTASDIYYYAINNGATYKGRTEKLRLEC